MAQNKLDWGVLRGALGVFSICVLISGVMLAGSYYFREEMASEYRSHHAKFRDASRKYLAVDEEERIIEQHYPEFVRLYRKGIIGRERRLNWLETLNTAVNTIRLPEMSYKIDSQTIYEPEFPLNLGAFDLYATDMRLTLGLLHEGDLARLIGAMDRNAEGLYSIGRCNMVRADEKSGFDPNVPNIQAECDLTWYTLDLKGARKVTL